jgi:hypothetical protein
MLRWMWWKSGKQRVLELKLLGKTWVFGPEPLRNLVMKIQPAPRFNSFDIASFENYLVGEVDRYTSDSNFFCGPEAHVTDVRQGMALGSREAARLILNEFRNRVKRVNR